MVQTTVNTPLRRGGFTFKQFFVAHDRCAMKVGNDGVLLGAWAPAIGAGRVLDIGTGSDLIALMLAPRWWLLLRTDVSDRPGLPPHRLLLALTRRPTPLIHDTLTLHDPTGAWSPAFRVLARDFYLAF